MPCTWWKMQIYSAHWMWKTHFQLFPLHISIKRKIRFKAQALSGILALVFIGGIVNLYSLCKIFERRAVVWGTVRRTVVDAVLQCIARWPVPAASCVRVGSDKWVRSQMCTILRSSKNMLLWLCCRDVPWHSRRLRYLHLRKLKRPRTISIECLYVACISSLTFITYIKTPWTRILTHHWLAIITHRRGILKAASNETWLTRDEWVRKMILRSRGNQTKQNYSAKSIFS